MASKIGTLNTVKLFYCRACTIAEKDFGIPVKSRAVRLVIKKIDHPIWVRSVGSDIYVAEQAFIQEEHLCVSRLGDVRLIIDCGANIGCTAAYLMTAYPQARLIAIEPDPENYRMLARNLEPYRNRAIAIHGAIWARGCESVSVCRGEYRDGLDWSVTVKPVETGVGGGVRAYNLDSLMQQYAEPGRGVDLLKVDIEGAEVELFEDESAEWCQSTRNLCVELHGEECERAFLKLRSRVMAEESLHDELRLLLNMRPTEREAMR